MDINRLLDRVTKLQLDRLDPPSHLLVHGALAFSLTVDDHQQIYVAAAFYGRRRVVVASHQDHINSPEQKQFILNAISWLDNGRQGNVAVEHELKNLHDILAEENVACELSSFKASASVYCCTLHSSKDADEVHKFVAEGKGVLIVGKARFWAQNNKDKNVLSEFPSNKILNRFGFSFLSILPILKTSRL
uniref:TRPM8 channel-associated factor homolog n=1 Tax=Geotrypetes seraphini TaxID=260995 RepID=A0A6P8QXA4_GEOSA|nr:TRPM8 channel-associated factor homolog [Geotrypetes seraphini]